MSPRGAELPAPPLEYSIQDGPQIFIVGNCQVRFLGAVLEILYPGRVHVVGKPFHAKKPQFCGLTNDFVPAAKAQQMIRGYAQRKVPVVAVGQASPMSLASLSANVDRADLSAEIIVPHLELYCLWPERRGLKDADDNKILRLYKGDVAALESSARKATVFRNAPDVVTSMVRSLPCFNSCNHPSGDLFVPLAEGVLSALGGQSLIEKSRAVLRRLATEPATDFDVAHPVPLRYLAAAGFEWGEHYVAWAEARRALDCRDFRRAYVKYGEALAGFPTNWKLRGEFAQAAFGVGDFERGLAFADWARAINMPNPDFQNYALYLLLQHGMQPDAVYRRTAIAQEVHTDHAPLHGNLARACLKDPRLGDPEVHAERAWRMAPTNEHIACLLARVLWNKCRKRDAICVLEEFVSTNQGATFSVPMLENYRNSFVV